MRRDHLDTLDLQFSVQGVTVVRFVANQVLRRRLNHVEFEAQLHQRDFMMVRRVSADRERQPLPVHDPHDFHAFSALRRADLRATPLRRREHRVNETLRFVQAAPLAERIGHIHQDIPEHLVAAPRLEAAMHGLVVRITLRQHMPLGARVQNPQDRLQHPAGGNGFATRSPRNTTLLRKVLPNPFPLLVGQLHHHNKINLIRHRSPF